MFYNESEEMILEEVFIELVVYCFILNEVIVILGFIDGFCFVEIKSYLWWVK